MNVTNALNIYIGHLAEFHYVSTEENITMQLQYCAKVMQTIIDEYREYRDISAIFDEILP